ncbi:transcription factor TFIIIC subunit [Saccharomycopsis crataegensis]|uniref:Transcription factor TFIIIC subunit n=1 Tax=Saccharomycopsis crataegensis TaxID=43959 RepID=A0AAV5QMW9_9ASCO|nr:transcription factor TFIIIC subunit [Saccharomycopsis crataegensis]
MSRRSTRSKKEVSYKVADPIEVEEIVSDPEPVEKPPSEPKVKRGRGRPRKYPLPETSKNKDAGVPENLLNVKSQTKKPKRMLVDVIFKKKKGPEKQVQEQKEKEKEEEEEEEDNNDDDDDEDDEFSPMNVDSGSDSDEEFVPDEDEEIEEENLEEDKESKEEIVQDDEDLQVVEEIEVELTRSKRKSEAKEPKTRVTRANRKSKDNNKSPTKSQVKSEIEQPELLADEGESALDLIDSYYAAPGDFGTKPLSGKFRLINFYGDNVQMSLSIAKYNMEWRQSHFTMNKEVLIKLHDEHTRGKFTYNYKKYWNVCDEHFKKLAKFESLDQNQYAELLGDHKDDELQIQVNMNEEIKKMKYDEILKLEDDTVDKSRDSFVINVNGVVTCLEWLNNDYEYQSHDNYLFVGVARKHDNKKQVLIDTNLSIFQQRYNEDYPSFLKCFKFNNESKTLQLHKIWVFSGYGPIRSMKFVPLKPTPDHLGLLGVLFSDGVLRFFNVDQNSKRSDEVEIMKVVEPAFKIKVPNFQFITCFEYLNSESIIIGTNCGYIGEFSFCSTDDNADEEEQGVPTFFIKKHSDYVYRIIIQPSIKKFCPTLIHSVSYEGTWKVTDYDNIHLSNSCERWRFMLQNMVFDYIPSLFSVVYTAGDAVKGGSTRNMKWINASYIRHLNNSIPTSFASSNWHPFVMSGANNGEIIVTNGADSPLQSTKMTKYVDQFKVWKFEYSSNTDTFKLGNRITKRGFIKTQLRPAERKRKLKKLETVHKKLQMIDINAIDDVGPPPIEKTVPPLEKIKKLDDFLDDANYEPLATVIYPAEAVVSHLKWCENVQGFNWYAASLPRDLVVIDCIAARNEDIL